MTASSFLIAFRRNGLKIVLYGVVSVLVFAASVFIHRPRSVEKLENEPLVTETQESPPLGTIRSNDDKGHGDLDRGDIDRPSTLPDEKKGFVKKPRTGLQKNKTQESSFLSTIQRDDDKDKPRLSQKYKGERLPFEGFKGKDSAFGESPFGEFGDGDHSGRRFE